MKDENTDPKGRREFLKTGVAVGAGAAAVALLPDAGAAVVEESSEDRPGKKGYQVSQHVLDYYRTARI